MARKTAGREASTRRKRAGDAQSRKPAVVAKRRTRTVAPKPARKSAAKAGPAAPRQSSRSVIAKAQAFTLTELGELNELRAELERAAGSASSPLRWNADPADVQRSVAQLVLTLVEFIRRLLERQAIRRMEAGTLTPGQIEDVGQALMKLEETVRDIAGKFGIKPEELNLELGPVGKLM